jgi:broad specificity phosphatase PhoE
MLHLHCPIPPRLRRPAALPRATSAAALAFAVLLGGTAAAQTGRVTDMSSQTDSVLAAAHWRAPRDSTVATFLIVRHAEKNTAMLGHDVPLTEQGAARARELRRVVGEAGVDAIYATPTQRAMQTGQPLAAALGESLTVVNDTGEIVRRLKTRHWGQVVVVVGHSDTVPQIVQGLTGARVPSFEGGEHDLLYVVTLTRDGRSSLLRLRYGAKS